MNTDLLLGLHHTFAYLWPMLLKPSNNVTGTCNVTEVMVTETRWPFCYLMVGIGAPGLLIGDFWPALDAPFVTSLSSEFSVKQHINPPLQPCGLVANPSGKHNDWIRSFFTHIPWELPTRQNLIGVVVPDGFCVAFEGLTVVVSLSSSSLSCSNPGM